MTKLNIDNTVIEKLLDFPLTFRARKVARYYYTENLSTQQIADKLGLPEVIIVTDIILIEKIIKENLVKRVCGECGDTFYSKQPQVRLCQKCKDKKREEIIKKGIEERRSFHVKSKPKKKIKSLTETIRETERYNREHGTCLSYGQYVLMRDSEK